MSCVYNSRLLTMNLNRLKLLLISILPLHG